MSKLKVYDMSGSAQGEHEVADSMLVLDRGEQAVQEALVAQRAAGRAGTASTLTKGEVAGHNKKPWRQKGTGQARAGYRQSPIWRGGGVVFGPKPRSYAKDINRKTRQLAFRRALSEKINDGAVIVIEKLEVEEVKTKTMAALLKALEIKGAVLFVTAEPNENVSLAARNIPKSEVSVACDVNVYQLLRYPVIVAEKAGMDALQKRLEMAKGGKEES